MIYLRNVKKVFTQEVNKKAAWLKEKFEDISVFIFLICFFTIFTPIAMIIVLIRLTYDRSYRHEIFGIHIRQ